MLHSRLLIKSLEHDEGQWYFAVDAGLVEAVDWSSVLRLGDQTLLYGKVELMREEKYKGGVRSGTNTMVEIRGTLL